MNNLINDYSYPETNKLVSAQIFIIEVGLRELIIEEFTKVNGERWYKTLLPTDVYQKYLRGRQLEKVSKWSNHINHHPIYYIDFPDLAKVMEKNWQNIFLEMFGQKTVFLSSLKSIEPIRNKFAHNRKLTRADSAIVSGVFCELEAALSSDRLKLLVKKCSEAIAIDEKIYQLREDLQLAKKKMMLIEEPEKLVNWNLIKNEWWFDSDYLTGDVTSTKLEIEEQKLRELSKVFEGQKKKVEKIKEHISQNKKIPLQEKLIEPISSFFDLYQQYSELPRGRGVGHNLESWVQLNDVLNCFENAENALSSICLEEINE